MHTILVKGQGRAHRDIHCVPGSGVTSGQAHTNTQLLIICKSCPGENQPVKRCQCRNRHIVLCVLCQLSLRCLAVLIQFAPIHQYLYTYADVHKQ